MKKRWTVLLLVTLIGTFLDWFTKYLADSKLTFGLPIPVVGDFFQLLLVYNKGAVFGLNPRSFFPGFPVNTFFIIFTIAAIVMLLIYFKNINRKDVLTHWGIMLILPGALGNLLDRLLHSQKGVIDFLKIGVSNNVYRPIFNFADVYVSLGVIILCISFILEVIHKKSKFGSVTD